MTASTRSSKTITSDHSHDLEALGKTPDTALPTEEGSSSEKSISPWEVSLEKSEDPKNMSTWYKWTIVLIVSSGAMCATSASSMARSFAWCILVLDLTHHASTLLGCFYRNGNHEGVRHISCCFHPAGIPLSDGFGNRTTVRWTGI